ncbi:GntR family transcriptional regulator [Paenibacillus humicola]|uniref:GntR family transcriptional regulator n=1 Tax=Paenibacillus humicola TaxID=3110540 RepID=UPI00237B1066|nr:GntR family transcriptional regulator [Paenibacillus humicola]
MYKKIVHYLLDEIQSGRLKPADRIPSEKELGQMFQVSRITSKKALDQLSQSGMVERIRGKGSFVTVSPPVHFAPFQESPKPLPIAERLIGIVSTDYSETFGLEILRTIERLLSRMQYHLIVKFTNGCQDREEQAIRSLVQAGVKGMIVCPVNGEHYNAELLQLVYKRFPVVLVDKYLKGIPACAVYTDNKLASQVLTNYLLEEGYERIAFISSSEENTSSIEERVSGFTSALLQRGIMISQSSLFTKLSRRLSDKNGSRDEDNLRSFLEENPQIKAFVACEYYNAVLLASVLKKMGKKIPEDCAIACFDFIKQPIGEKVFPHIKQDETALGEKAVELLLAQLEGKEVPLQTVIDFKLVRHDSFTKGMS